MISDVLSKIATRRLWNLKQMNPRGTLADPRYQARCFVRNSISFLRAGV